MEIKKGRELEMKYTMRLLCIAALFCLFASASSAEAGIWVGNMKADKVLFLGNSLTHHPPKEEIGWTGDWGMAASSQSKDYAHLVAGEIASVNGGSQPAVQAVNIYNYGMFEQNYTTYDAATELAALTSWQPDVLVIQLGDNSTASLTTPAARTAFAAGLAEVIAAFDGSDPELFVVSTWWPSAVTDGILEQVCADAGGAFVDISDVYGTPANRGFRDHPSDAGMAVIAGEVWTTIVANSVPEPGSMALLIAGLVCFAAYGWRKCKKA
ncbi:MAG: SGNH/GDSL hydrolase family protein [Pirellulales bacterium]|nr:SGNH/GDSL hydrolase family protein [Pirellulales bacterium]